jgi:hypothetical protein
LSAARDTEDDAFGSSGGGISDLFPVPPYQASIALPKDITTGKTGRGVPYRRNERRRATVAWAHRAD